MKKIFLLPILWLFCTLAAAQNIPGAPHDTPQNADDTILLTLPDEGETAWRRAAQVLVARGYTLAYSDVHLLTLSTDFTNLQGSSGYLSVFMLINGNQLTLRARSSTAPLHTGSLSVVRRGALLGVSRDWLELDAIVRELGGTPRYQRSVAW